MSIKERILPTKESTLSTKETIGLYFKRLDEKKDWEESIAGDMVFTGVATRTEGRDAYVQTTLGFLKVVTGVKIMKLVVEGEQACVEAHYAIVSPRGDRSVCKVAEFLSVRDGKILSSTIFFDTAAFREFMAKG